MPNPLPWRWRAFCTGWNAPDTGPGLTKTGKALVRLCNALGIMIDLSHINEAGFDDVAALSDAPLVATHSNAHALCPSPRNPTDRQLHMIRETGGMVGLNFATFFLNPDGRSDTHLGWDTILHHLDHMIAVLGEDHVGLGSDFDGCVVPDLIGDVTGVPRLLRALSAHGYDDALLRKLARENWLACLERTWKWTCAEPAHPGGQAGPQHWIPVAKAAVSGPVSFNASGCVTVSDTAGRSPAG